MQRRDDLPNARANISQAMYRGDFVDLSYPELCAACSQHLHAFQAVPPFNIGTGAYNLIRDMTVAANARGTAVARYNQDQRDACHNLHVYFTASQGSDAYQSYDDAIKKNGATSALQGILPIQDIMDDAGVSSNAVKTRTEYQALQAAGFYAVREAQGDGSCYMNALLQSHIENTIVGLGRDERREVFMHMAKLLRENLKDNSRFLQDGRDPKEIEYLISRFESAANGTCWLNVQEFRHDFAGKMPRERDTDPDGAWLMQRAFRYVWAQHLLDNRKKEVVVKHPDLGDEFDMRYPYDELYRRAGYGEPPETLEGYVNFLTQDGDLIEGSDALLPALLGCDVELKQRDPRQGAETETITTKWPGAVVESALTRALDKLPKITILRSGVHYKSLLTEHTYRALRAHELQQRPANAPLDYAAQQLQQNGYRQWERAPRRIPRASAAPGVALSSVPKSQRAVEDEFRMLANSANGNLDRLIQYIHGNPSLYGSSMSLDYLVAKFMDIDYGPEDFVRFIQQINTNAQNRGFNDFCSELLRTLDAFGCASLQQAKSGRMQLPSYEIELPPPTTFASSDVEVQGFHALVGGHPRDLPAMINYLSDHPDIYHEAAAIDAVVSAFFEADYSPEQFAYHMLEINKQASKHGAPEFARQLLNKLREMQYEPCFQALQLRSRILAPIYLPPMRHNEDGLADNWVDGDDYLTENPENDDGGEDYEDDFVVDEEERMNRVEKRDLLTFFSDPTMMFDPIANAATERNQEGNLLEGHDTALPKPRMVKIADLTAGLPQRVPQGNRSTLNRIILSGCDSRRVASFPCMASSIRQVASQFNNGESKGRYPTNPREFCTYPTQGPAEQRTTWRPAIARFCNAEFCDDLQNFKDDELFNEIFDYQYGYLTPKLHKEAQCLAWLEENIQNIYLNVERVHIDDSDHTAIQVLNASLALGQCDTWVRQRTRAGIANLKSAVRVVLKAQYEAVAAVAIREAQANPGKRIPVVFTLVGGYAFGNDPEDIAEAFQAAMTLLENAGLDNIDVCLSIYSGNELAIYKGLLPDFFDKARTLTEGNLTGMATLPKPLDKMDFGEELEDDSEDDSEDDYFIGDDETDAGNRANKASVADMRAFCSLFEQSPGDLEAIMSHIKETPSLYYEDVAIDAVVGAFGESNYNLEDIRKIDQFASTYNDQFATKIYVKLVEMRYEFASDNEEEENVAGYTDDEIFHAPKYNVSPRSSHSIFSNRFASQISDIDAQIIGQEKERDLDEITGAIFEGLDEYETDFEERAKYTARKDESEQEVSLSYQKTPQTIIPVLEAKSASVKVFKSWRKHVKDADVSLSKKALIVLKSLGIPPCPPENIYISNEDSSLGKEIRKQYKILGQNPDIVVSIRRSNLGD